MTPNCKYHTDRVSTHVADVGTKIPVCDECATDEREKGILVFKHEGYLWGLPVIVKPDDILDEQIIDD